ncbi:PREDICTED: osteomodulin-like [Polistes dominula]|uniref:Osteomodulin-like n=1 Tax=Polistes dominula TaxID=743375 RepID=A0ABM1IJ71_POLDO|nr:PREDICTED: osteomodulin-like [Polistes dominula]
MISCLLATTISFDPINYEENLSMKFEEPMDKCDTQQQENVNLVNLGLKVVRDYFISSNNLKSINLENNQIIEIAPYAFNAIPNLSCLNIRRNNLTDIFYNFLPSFRHSSLEKLNLANTTFQSDLDYSVNMDPLISDKEIEQGVTKDAIPNLTHLDISDNNLVEIPKYLGISFPRLTHLYMSDNKLNSIFFNRLPATLEYIYIERNRGNLELTTFPNNISALFLSHNRLYWSIKPTNLYPNLKVLSIRNCNDIITIIQFLEKGKLVDLDISQNDLVYIEAELFKNAKSLEPIDEDAFSNLKMLEKLDLAENNLIKLPESWMYNLEQLNYLNLKSNLFSNLDSMSIYVRSNLSHLYLQQNKFASIKIESLMILPTNVEVYLSSIKIRRNRFNVFDDC